MNTRLPRAATVADAAESVQEVADFDSREYAYAAGVEDALRWVLGDVSDAIFLGGPAGSLGQLMVTAARADREGAA